MFLKSQVFLQTALVLVLVSSCKKGTNQDDPVPIPLPIADTCKILKIIYTPQYGGGATGYIDCSVTYTGNNISKMIYSTPGSVSTEYFTYFMGDKVKSRQLYFQGSSQLQEAHNYAYPYDPSFAVYQSLDGNYFSGAFQMTGLTQYAYNGADGTAPVTNSEYIEVITSTNPNVIYSRGDLLWKHDDPVSFRFTDPNSAGIRMDSIFYDTTKINKFNSIFKQFRFQGVNVSGEIFGSYSKYMFYHFLGKHMITKVTGTGNSFYKMYGNFTYTYNSSNLVKDIKLDGLTVLQFFYTCD